MPGRHEQGPAPRLGRRWVAGALSLGIAAAATGVLAIAPAGATATTTDAQLSLTGVATSSSVVGGTTVGVHPGDTVDFKASAVPTTGLAALGLSSLVTLLSTLGTYQVVLTTGTNFPGGARTLALGGPTSGPCKGAAHLPVTFATIGTYGFTWKVQYVLPLLLGCSKTGLNSTELNQLRSVGVAINASNQWTGQIVVALDPPTGGISVQLPGVGVSPSVPVLGTLPAITVPPLGVPTLPVTAPTAPGSGGTSQTPGTSTPPLHFTPPPLSVPEQAMGGIGGGGGGGFGGVGPDGGTATQLGSGLPNVPVAGGFNLLPPAPRGKPQVSTKRIDLAANRAPAAQLPVLLAIIAIIALSLVTATYARLYLLRRNI